MNNEGGGINMEDKSKDESRVKINAKSNIVIGGDVVGGNKTPIDENDLETGQGSGGGITLTGVSVSISGDVVGGRKTFRIKNLDDQPISCPNCGRSYLPSKNNFACPNCGRATPKEFLSPTL
jgi:hypothetical protein